MLWKGDPSSTLDAPCRSQSARPGLFHDINDMYILHLAVAEHFCAIRMQVSLLLKYWPSICMLVVFENLPEMQALVCIELVMPMPS